jgi:hypothetical protein
VVWCGDFSTVSQAMLNLMAKFPHLMAPAILNLARLALSNIEPLVNLPHHSQR